jgi:hypothetical protein
MKPMNVFRTPFPWNAYNNIGTLFQTPFVRKFLSILLELTPK